MFLTKNSRSQIQKEQLNEPEIGPVYDWVKNQTRPDKSEIVMQSQAVRYYWHIFDTLKLQDGLLVKNFHKKDNSGCYLQLVTPKILRKEVINLSHDNLLSGHLGRKKTQEKVVKNFFWFEMREDISAHVSGCKICERNRRPYRAAKAKMGNMTIGSPLERLSTDILGPLPETPRGNKYILTATDHFTNWVVIYPISDLSAATTARVLLNGIIGHFGCPLTILSDQGRNYESQIF